MGSAEHQFFDRVSHIPFHGLGLSVDVYSPDLYELIEQLERSHLSYGYMEIFKATRRALKNLRTRLPSALFEYHADGLWVTQPHWSLSDSAKEEVVEAEAHIQSLGCHWVNQECASKQMAGYSFGTYLPPLFTRESADVTAQNVWWLQSQIDQWANERQDGHCPLVLIETPPLTYFSCGDLSYQEYFRLITDAAPCGLVLDIGHLWTAFRYGTKGRYPHVEAFLDEFLRSIPLERVVEIHVAGLDIHVTRQEPLGRKESLPYWIDSHSAPVPAILFRMLDGILRYPGLTNLQGVALEVDTKAIDLIVTEFAAFRERYEWWERKSLGRNRPEQVPSLCQTAGNLSRPVRPDDSSPSLVCQYEQYVDLITGKTKKSDWMVSREQIDHVNQYVREYLPYEILEWGGDLKQMFPQTLLALGCQRNGLEDFVQFWFDRPRPIHGAYDYFLLKVERFVEFINERFPECRGRVDEEANELRKGYAMASDDF